MTTPSPKESGTIPPYKLADVVAAIERRLEWAQTILENTEYTEAEKVWVRRYETDVPVLLALLRSPE